MVIYLFTYISVVLFWVIIDIKHGSRHVSPVNLLLRLVLYFSFVPLIFLIIFRYQLQFLSFDYVVLLDDINLNNYLVAYTMYAIWGLLMYLFTNSGRFYLLDKGTSKRKNIEKIVLVLLFFSLSLLFFSGAVSDTIENILENPLIYLLRREALSGLSPLFSTIVAFIITILIPVFSIYLVIYGRKKWIFAIITLPFSFMTFQKAPGFAIVFSFILRIIYSVKNKSNRYITLFLGLAFISCLYSFVSYQEFRGNIDFLSNLLITPLKIFARIAFTHHVSNISFFDYQGVYGFIGVNSDRFLSLILQQNFYSYPDLVFDISKAVYGQAWSNNAGFIGASFLMGGFGIIFLNLIIYTLVFLGFIIGLKLIDSKEIEKLITIYFVYITPAFVGTNMATVLFFYKVAYLGVFIFGVGMLMSILRAVSAK